MPGGRRIVLVPHTSQPVIQALKCLFVFAEVTSVACGHVPHGDCPNVIVSKGVRVLTADTSYSCMGHVSSWGKDNRGAAAAAISFNPSGTHVDVKGVLADGCTEYCYSLCDPSLPATEQGADCDQYVGRQLADGRWVKAKLVNTGSNESQYLLVVGKGFVLTPSYATAEELSKSVWVE